MTFDSDSYGEMHRLPFRDSPISDDTAERLLSGRVPAADTPEPYRRLVSLFEIAAGAPTGAETAHKATVVAAAVAAIEGAVPVGAPHSPLASGAHTHRRSLMLSKLLTAKAAAVATVAALGLGTAAAAATGALPTQTSHANSHASAGLAIAASSSSGSHSGGTDKGQGKGSSGSSSTGAVTNTNAQFGLCTAFLAHHPASTTPASSVPSDSSRTFSALISGHGGLAGTTTYCQKIVSQHNTTATTDDTSTGPNDHSSTAGGSNKPADTGRPASTPPVSTPNSGGTGTADTASGGASSTGTSTANTSSGGASSAGSGNAGGH